MTRIREEEEECNTARNCAASDVLGWQSITHHSLSSRVTWNSQSTLPTMKPCELDKTVI